MMTSALILAGCDLNDDNDDDDDNGNDLTGNSEVYEIHPAEGSDVSGIVAFEERTDGSTLVTIELDGTDAGAEHPAHIHSNAAVEGGGIVLHFEHVDGSSGTSETLVSSLEDGTAVSYDDLISYDGHVMVHLSENELGTIMGRGDIGGNAFTGESVTYELHEANESGISGEVHFEERNNGNTLATIELSGTPEEGDHPAHIHDNSVEEGGGIAVPFNNVDGSTGIGRTNIRADETSVEDLTYTALLDFDGHVNVHLSDDDFSVIAQGNIGANDEGEQNNGNGGGNGIEY